MKNGLGWELLVLVPNITDQPVLYAVCDWQQRTSFRGFGNEGKHWTTILQRYQLC